jgi:hypothetical protein
MARDRKFFFSLKLEFLTFRGPRDTHKVIMRPANENSCQPLLNWMPFLSPVLVFAAALVVAHNSFAKILQYIFPMLVKLMSNSFIPMF